MIETIAYLTEQTEMFFLPPPRRLCFHLYLDLDNSRQEPEAITATYLSVCLLVYLLTGLLKNYRSNLYELLWNSFDQSITF